jgi:hypothetical protein
MGFKLSGIKTDPTKETSGVWFPVGNGARVLVARITSPKYEEYLRKLGKPYGRAIRAGQIDNEAIEEITKKALAKHILLGWEGLENEDGTPIEYSLETAYKILTDPEYKDFYRMILDFAQDAEAFRNDAREEAAGNS